MLRHTILYQNGVEYGVESLTPKLNKLLSL